MKVRGGPDKYRLPYEVDSLLGWGSRRVFLSRVLKPTHGLPLPLPFLAPSFLLLTLEIFHCTTEAQQRLLHSRPHSIRGGLLGTEVENKVTSFSYQNKLINACEHSLEGVRYLAFCFETFVYMLGMRWQHVPPGNGDLLYIKILASVCTELFCCFPFSLA